MKNFFDDNEYKRSKMRSKLQYRRVVFRIISDIYDEALCEKCPNTEFFLLRIFLYSDWIRRFTIQSEQRKIRTRKKIRIWTLFTQWNFFTKIDNGLKSLITFAKKTPACTFGVCLKYASEQCSFNIKTYFKGEWLFIANGKWRKFR